MSPLTQGLNYRSACDFFVTLVFLRCAVCRQMLKELLDVLSQDRSPVGNSRLPPVIDPTMQRQLSHFSAITHGFGTPAMVAALNVVQSYLTESVKAVDRQMRAPALTANEHLPTSVPPSTRPKSESC